MAGALTLHRGPYTLRGMGMTTVTSRACARAEWRPDGELALEIENDFGVRRINLSPKQVDRLVSFLLAPYVVSTREEVSLMGKKGKGKSGGRGGRC